VKSRKQTSERAKHRENRATLAEFLEDALTDPAAPLSGSEYERMRLASTWMGWFDRLDKLEASADGKVEMLSEMRISIALECLRRLAEMKPAGHLVALRLSVFMEKRIDHRILGLTPELLEYWDGEVKRTGRFA
jgi:hypothetical protein